MAWLQQLSQKRPTRQGLFGLLAASRTPPCFVEDGDVGVGVFPDLEEVLVGAFGLGGLTCHRVNARFEDEPEVPGGS
jgi:hypothetical protein